MSLPTPVVPLPHELRIDGECLRRGEVFGAELPPQSVVASECRDAARRRHARAGQDDGRLRRTEAGNQFLVSTGMAKLSFYCSCRDARRGRSRHRSSAPRWTARAATGRQSLGGSVNPTPPRRGRHPGIILNDRPLARQDRCGTWPVAAGRLDTIRRSQRIASPARSGSRRNRLHRARAPPAVRVHRHAAGRAGEPLFPPRHRGYGRREKVGYVAPEVAPGLRARATPPGR